MSLTSFCCGFCKNTFQLSSYNVVQHIFKHFKKALKDDDLCEFKRCARFYFTIKPKLNDAEHTPNLINFLQNSTSIKNSQAFIDILNIILNNDPDFNSKIDLIQNASASCDVISYGYVDSFVASSAQKAPDT